MRDAASTPRDSAQGLQSPRIVLPDFRGRIGRPFRGRAQSSHPEVPCGPEAQRRNSLHLFLRALPGKSGKMHENSHLGSFAAVSRKALVFPALGQYTGRRSGGRVVEGTPLLRVQARKGLEGSNPFHSGYSVVEVNHGAVLLPAGKLTQPTGKVSSARCRTPRPHHRRASLWQSCADVHLVFS